jgi:23S rRNA (guanosine2251-2'-O)-methyltransferase
MIAIFDDIRSRHNVGSMFRTADAAGIEKIYVCGVTPAPIDVFGRSCPKIAKVALGAEKSIAWERKTYTIRFIQSLKKQGFFIVCAEICSAAIPYTDFDISENRKNKIALIMGNEVGGLSEKIFACADTVLAIPMRGEKESLNVSVAFGILAFHLNIV